MKMDRRLLFAFAVLALGCALAGAAEMKAGGGAETDRAIGQRIYREGILPSGKPMAGMAPAGVLRTGKDAACIACHRRSGFGTAEGSFVIRPITGPDLYQTRVVTAANPRIAHQLGKPLRPAYDDAALARAIRDGVDITGRNMQGMMPRYALDDREMTALLTYLKTLFAEEAVGVNATEIHFATVIQPNVSEAKRRAMLDVLEAFVRDKNAGVRSEEARRTAGTMRMHRAYRKWVLHVWDLVGTPESWGGQLEERYRQQPVFALVAGLGAATWQPIHAFAEQFDVPSVLPLTDLPATGADNFYTVYFSRGISLEADALAQFLGNRRDGGRIIQVYRPDDAGAVAAEAFRAALPGADRRLEDRPLVGEPDAGFWRELAGTSSTAIVLWLGRRDLVDANGAVGGPEMSPVYLSTTLLDGQVGVPGIPALLTYPWDVPATREPRVLRSKLWLRMHGLDSPDEGVQAVAVNTLFAITVAGDALAHLQDSFSRDYFVERVEHNINTTLMPSLYPHMNLGPGKRFASKGAYIVRPEAPPNQALTAVSEWIVP
ncbi:MAG: c-type cytochrome [Pseudomonadota bacterium]